MAQQPSHANMLTLDALGVVANALSDVHINDSDIGDVLRVFPGVYKDQHALANAKVYILSKFARQVQNPRAQGPYPQIAWHSGSR